jgi:intein-encoded DNA endonuclease-like protein
MILVSKTLKKVVIEVHTKEIEDKGFDYIWDKIREVYKINDYEIFTIEKSKDKSLVFIELSSK